MDVPEKLKRYRTQMTIRRKVVQNLRQIIDPELGVNMVDLGLVFNIIIDDEYHVSVEYVVTTPGCPMSRYFQNKVEEALLLVEEIEDFKSQRVMEPQWDIKMMKQDLELFAAQPPAYRRQM